MIKRARFLKKRALFGTNFKGVDKFIIECYNFYNSTG